MASLSNDKQSQEKQQQQQQQPNKPSYTNWFNSLRRNKQKKPITPVKLPDTPAPLQRSCIDLSNSIFYLKDVTGDLDVAGTSSTANIYVDEEEMRTRGGTMSKLCSPCCGTQQSDTSAVKETSNWSTTTLQRQSPVKYENLLEMPERTKDNVVTLVSRRSDFLRTTTVTTTHTIVITRPVEVLVNSRGEIVAKKAHQLKRRTNSLDCILDEQGVSTELGSSLLGGRTGVLASYDDLQFIDENNSNNHRSSNCVETTTMAEKNNERNKYVVESAEIIENYDKKVR